jgi:L-rhamnose mutarotase
MPRIAFRLWLKPDPEGIEVYVWNHLNPFDGLYDAIREAGIEHYTIWLDEADLFLTREGETPEKGEKMDLSDPIQQQWSDTLTPLFDERVKREGAGRPTEVFSLDPDGAVGPAQMTYRTGLQPGPAAMDTVADAYRSMPEDVVAALRAAGVRREWTWVEDGSAWTYRETDDLDATEAALVASPAYRAWQAAVADRLDERTRREGPRRTREVFRCD